MKKKFKFFVTITIIATVLLGLIPSGYAIDIADETNFYVLLTADKTKIEKGETVDVTISLGNFKNIGEGLNSFMGDLEYDKTKLSIEASQIVAQNGWDAPTYENDKLLTLKGSMIKAKEAIMKMTFTVKSDAELGKTTIRVKNVEAANTENDFIGTQGAIEIDIVEEIKFTSNIYNVLNNKVSAIKPETTIKNFLSNIETNATGVEFYKEGVKVTDEEEFVTTGMTLKLSLHSEALEFTFVVTGDINGDGKVKLSDLSKLKYYLLGKETLEGEYKEAADLTKDGDVKLSDLSKMKFYLVKKIDL